MKRIAIRLAGIAIFLACQAAAAQTDPRYYTGAGVGASDIDNRLASGLLTSGTIDGSDTGFQLFGGYRFGPYGALELAYVDLGKLGYSGDFFGTPVSGGSVKVSGFGVSALALYPARPQLELFAKAGLFAWDVKVSDVTAGTPFSSKDDGVDLSFGFGAQYFFRKNVAARLAWEHYEMDMDGANLLGAGLLVRF